MEKRNKELIKNTSVLTFGMLCTKGIMFIMTPFFTRWLSQSDYGTFDIFANYTTLLIPIITLDIGEAVFRMLIGDDEQNRKTIISIAAVVNIIGLCLSLLIIELIPLFIPSVGKVFSWFYLVLAAETIYTFFSMIMRGLKHLLAFAISNIIYVCVMVLASLILVKKLSMGLQGIFLSYGIGYTVASIYMGIVCHIGKYVSIKNFEQYELRRMLKYSIPLIPNAIGWWIINISDRTIVSLFLGVESNAVLAVTHKLPNLCQTLFSRFHLSWQQSAAESINDKDKDSFFSRVFNRLIVVISSGVIVLITCNYLYFKLFSVEYFDGYYIAPILMVSMLVYSATQFIGGIHNANMETKKNGSTTLIGAIINITVHLALIRFIGLFAAVISTLIAYLIIFIIRYLDIKKSINLTIDKKSIVCAIMVPVFFTLNYTCVSNSTIHFLLIISSCIIAAYMNEDIIRNSFNSLRNIIKTLKGGK